MTVFAVAHRILQVVGQRKLFGVFQIQALSQVLRDQRIVGRRSPECLGPQHRPRFQRRVAVRLDFVKYRFVIVDISYDRHVAIVLGC